MAKRFSAQIKSVFTSLMIVGCGTRTVDNVYGLLTMSPARQCECISRGLYSHCKPSYPLPSAHALSAHACFTPQSTYILSTTLSSTLRIHNIHTSKVLRTFRHPSYLSERFPCPSVVFAKPASLDDESAPAQTSTRSQHDNAWVVAGSENGMAVIWDVATKAEVGVLSGHTRPVVALAVSHFTSHSRSLDYALTCNAVCGLLALITGTPRWPTDRYGLLGAGEGDSDLGV